MNFFKLLLPRRNHARPEEQTTSRAANGGSVRDDHHDRRRVARVEAATPVYVYARAGDEPFAESTKTVNVSVNGGCITLSTKIARAQKIIVTNAQTDEDLACRVARSVRTGKNVVVGLEFLEPCPHFWGIEFETASAPVSSS